MSATSGDSVVTLRDQRQSREESRGTNRRWTQRLQRELNQLQAALNAQGTVVGTITDVVSRMQRVLQQAQARHHLLSSYVHALPAMTITEQRDDNTFSVTAPSDDVTVQIKMDVLKKRLCDVIAQQQNAPFTADVTSLISELQDLLTEYSKFSTHTHTSMHARTYTHFGGNQLISMEMW
jgi:hypothetical protein